MAYNDTPLAAQAKNDSQPLIQQNFQLLQTYLQLNHDNLNTGTGKHTHVTMPVLAAPATLVGELALYTKTTAGSSQLYMRRDNVATEVPVSVISGGNATFGCSYVGGLKILWGSGATVAGTKIVNIAANAGINWPGFTVTPTIQLTRVAPGPTVIHNVVLENGTVTNLQFVVKSVDTTNGSIAGQAAFNFLAIGF